jgi:photosystem II stability/assembly factor-like uncharacterized protein
VTSRARRIVGPAGLCVLAAAVSCGRAAEMPTIAEAPPAHVESLLAPGALWNAVELTASGGGAAVGELGAIFVTADAGATWRAVDSGTGQSLKGVAILDGMTAVAVGAGGTVLRTDDAGRTWAPLESGTRVDLRGVATSPDGVVLVVGESGVALRSEDAGRTWRVVPTGTASTLRAVEFLSSSAAVAVGDDGVLIRSTDAGRSWQSVASGTNVALRDVAFVDATTGVAVGGDDRRWRRARVVLRTEDGGATWQPIGAPTGSRLYGVTRNDAGHFIAAGEAGEAIRSTDGGRTWSAAGSAVEAAPNPGADVETSNWFAGLASSGSAVVGVTYGGRIYRRTGAAEEWTQVPEVALSSEVTAVSRVGAAGDGFAVAGGNVILRSAAGGALERAQTAGRGGRRGGGRGGGAGRGRGVLGLSFADGLTGVAVGVGGAVQRTTDGGKTWTNVENATERNLRGVAFADDKVGIAVAGPAGTGPGMIRTDDGGLTWREQPCVPGTGICTSNTSLVAVALLPSRVGMAVGGSIVPVAIRTTDGGRTWVDVSPDTGRGSLQALALIDDTRAVAVGSRGQILHTADGGVTWTWRDSGTPLTLTGVAFADESRGLIVGQTGTVLTTSDGGVTWRREPPVTTRNLTAVAFETTDTAIITGSSALVLRHRWRLPTEQVAAATGRGGSRE